jgi:hypothetical protein
VKQKASRFKFFPLFEGIGARSLPGNATKKTSRDEDGKVIETVSREENRFRKLE